MQGTIKVEEQLDDSKRAASPFQVTAQELVDLVQKYKARDYDEELKSLRDDFGGVEGICQKLKVNTTTGLTGADFSDRSEHFGNNQKEKLKATPWCKLFLGQLDDFMLKILMVCAVVSITVDSILAANKDATCREYAQTAWEEIFALDPDTLEVPDESRCHSISHSWIEGTAILIAVLVVSNVGSTVDYKKEQQFVLKREQSLSEQKCQVLRNGTWLTEHPDNLHVGDVMRIQYGQEIPVDGICLQAQSLLMDEAAMTGESDHCKKEVFNFCMKRWEQAEIKNQQNAAKDGAKNMLRAHELPSPLIMSGTACAGGEGSMVAIMVGKKSAIGTIEDLLNGPGEETTPLQKKLEVIAEDIGKVGTYVALLVVHVLIFRWMVEGIINRDEPENNIAFFTTDEYGNEVSRIGDFVMSWVESLIIGVAIIVVAVPEGLPLAVMISLAYSISKMLVDQCDVKRLSSCEIMGGADNICSDKTGTLTLNSMKVTNCWSGVDVAFPQDQNEVTKEMSKLNWSDYIKVPGTVELITQAVGCNTAVNAGATDRAMIELLERCGESMEDIQKKHYPADLVDLIRFPFDSDRKRASTVIENVGLSGYNKRIHVKGASEIVTACCSHYLDAQGNRQPLSDNMTGEIANVIQSYAKQALRTIAVAYKDISAGECGEKHDNPEDELIKDIEKSGLTLICIFGIYDIVRQEVPQAVRTCKRAGITVRMVTGDNLITAMAIAVKCGIIEESEVGNEQICMEGKKFYERVGGLKCGNCKKHNKDCECEKKDRKEKIVNFKEFKQIAQHLKVVARSRPEDKYLLVTGLRQMENVVAVTGDGTNDAPALSKADVGFAMGITGTDVAKKACDIQVLDDNFTSIVKAAMWGRSVYDNIQRFLMFQLTVNVGALIVTFIGSCIIKQSPLEAIQLLWVNLIMDSLAALALATELPTPALLERPPQNRNDYIVSRKMIKHILGQALWQTFCLFFFLFYGDKFIPESQEYFDRNPDFQYKYEDENGNMVLSPYVHPGRPYNWDGSLLYKKIQDEAGPSRHMTFIFTSFVMMQIFNMFCARKIHDEFNIFSGLHKSWMFIVIFIIIGGGQFVITQFTGYVFSVHLEGLTGVQWGICIAVGATTLIINVLLKFLPDGVVFKMGQDSVDDRRLAAKAAKKVSA